jgi:integrase
MDFVVMGCRTHRSTGMTTKAEAEAVEHEAKKQLKESILHPRAQAPLLSVAFERAMAERWEKQDSQTVVRKRIRKIVRIFTDKPIDQITANEIQDFINKQEAEGLKPSTINGFLSTLSVMFDLAVDKWGVLEKKPYFKWERVDHQKTRILSYEEEARLVTIFKTMGRNEMADLVVFLIDTGMRISEALAAKYSHLDFDDRTIFIPDSKNDHPRKVPMTQRVYDLLQLRFKDRDLLKRVSKKEYGEHLFYITYPRCNVNWHTAKHLMGLDSDEEFTIHTLRHTCASRLIMAGEELYTVSKYLGHLDMKTTQRYAHLQMGKLKRAAAALDEYTQKETKKQKFRLQIVK